MGRKAYPTISKARIASSAFLRNGRVRLFTRKNNDWTESFPQLVRALEELPVRNAILDGEVVALNEKGVSDFQLLQNAIKGGGKVIYFLFDLPHCEGYSLEKAALVERKQVLAELLAGADGTVRLSEHIQGRGPEVYQQSCRLGLEGVISKRMESRYEHKRSGAWLKTKCMNAQEFVIGGFTDPAGSRTGFGSLLLGYYESDSKLRYCGRVGTGFNETTLRDLTKRLKKLETPKPALVNPPTRGEAPGAHWVQPKLVAQVRFAHFTADGSVRLIRAAGERLETRTNRSH